MVLFYDCFAGISGDMNLAVLIELGVPVDYLKTELQKLLKNEYILIALYTDDKTEVTDPEQIISSVDGKKKKTIGQINADIQISRFKSNALPYYVISNSKGEAIIEPIGFENNVEAFKAFLEKGLKEFHKK